jgi:hypothetical protein
MMKLAMRSTRTSKVLSWSNSFQGLGWGSKIPTAGHIEYMHRSISGDDWPDCWSWSGAGKGYEGHIGSLSTSAGGLGGGGAKIDPLKCL